MAVLWLALWALVVVYLILSGFIYVVMLAWAIVVEHMPWVA
jgi:hypothetical protein